MNEKTQSTVSRERKRANDPNKYIYNVDHADNLIKAGYICRGTGINKTSGHFWWAFDYEEIQPFYETKEYVNR